MSRLAALPTRMFFGGAALALIVALVSLFAGWEGAAPVAFLAFVLLMLLGAMFLSLATAPIVDPEATTGDSDARADAIDASATAGTVAEGADLASVETEPPVAE